MKIFIPFATKDIGGPSSFVNKFSLGMEKRGHRVVFQECEDYDVLLVIVQAPFSVLWRAKQRKKPVVQRLDGVFYWSVSGWMFPLLNLKAGLVRHFFAEHTVYQSRYSKYSVEKFLGKKFRDRHTIIYNGVDTALFSPTGSVQKLRDFPEQILFFTASEFRRTDQLFPLLKALQLLETKCPGSFKFLVAGRFIRELEGFEKKLSQYPWIHFLGKLENSALPEYERAADIFLFSHLNPPCPNNIIEALSCGLPICGIADGAMPELIQSGCEGLLVPIKGSGFWKRRNISEKELLNNIHSVLKNLDLFSQRARIRAQEKLSLEMMLDKYNQVFLSLI